VVAGCQGREGRRELGGAAVGGGNRSAMSGPNHVRRARWRKDAAELGHGRHGLGLGSGGRSVLWAQAVLGSGGHRGGALGAVRASAIPLGSIPRRSPPPAGGSPGRPGWRSSPAASGGSSAPGWRSRAGPPLPPPRRINRTIEIVCQEDPTRRETARAASPATASTVWVRARLDRWNVLSCPRRVFISRWMPGAAPRPVLEELPASIRASVWALRAGSSRNRSAAPSVFLCPRTAPCLLARPLRRLQPLQLGLRRRREESPELQPAAILEGEHGGPGASRCRRPRDSPRSRHSRSPATLAVRPPHRYPSAVLDVPGPARACVGLQQVDDPAGLS